MNYPATLKVTPVKQTPWYALPVITVLCLAVFFAVKSIRHVTTDSVQMTIALEVGGEPKTGDYIMFDLTNPVVPTDDNTVKVTKLLVCSQGQLLQRKQDTWYCDGKKLGTNRIFAMNGSELEQFYFDGVIPEDKGFAMGDGQNSFDSRYWGFVNLDEVTVVAKVL